MSNLTLDEINASIKHFVSLQKRYTTTHNGKQCQLVATALAALRECAERRVGCEYCDEDHAEHDYMNGVQTFKNGAYLVLETTEWNDYYDSYNDIRIAVQFCPKCGRKLK